MNALSWTRHIRLHTALSKQGEMRTSIFGPALARIPRRETTRVVVHPVTGGFTAYLHLPYRKGELQVHWQEEAGCWRPEASFRRFLRAAQERPVDLELPAEFILTQSVKLPRAALTNLSAAIAYGLPSWSPFEANEVYVTGNVDEVQTGHARIHLYYALKVKVDPLLVRLNAIGLPADRLVLDSLSNQSVTLSTPKLTRLQKARRIDGALAIMAVSLALLLGSLRIMILSHRLEEVETLLRSELAQFRQAETLQSTYASFIARRAAVSERRLKEVSTYELLVALAQHLPDGTLIQTLEVGDGRGRIDLSGIDSDATLRALRMIPILQNVKIEASRGPSSIVAVFEVPRKSL